MTFLVRAIALLLSFSCLQAVEAPDADPDLPQPIDFAFADELVMNSPFTRAVNLQESLQLTGVAYVDGHPIATVLNKETKQRFVVSEEPNMLGWTLVGASAGMDLHETQVEVRIGQEIVAMHYQGQQLSPAGGVNGSASRLAGSSKKDDGKFRPSSFLGDQGKEMYASLSPEARDKLKDLLKSRLEKHPGLTPEQNSDYARKVYAKIKASDNSPSKQAKPGKTPKIKQG